MDKLRFSPPNADGFRIKATAGVLAVAGIVTGCGGPISGHSYTERMLGKLNGTTQLDNGEKHLRIVEIDGETTADDQELVANGNRVNVRTYPGIDGLVLGTIDTGATLENVVLTAGDGGDWVAGKCDKMPIENIVYEALPRDENDYVVVPRVCFVNGNFAQNTDK